MYYDKYITLTTKKKFYEFKKSLINQKDFIIAFERFYADIKRNNRRLHSALGYWEPSLLEKYLAQDIVSQLIIVFYMLAFASMITSFYCILFLGLDSEATKVITMIWTFIIVAYTIICIIIMVYTMIRTIVRRWRRR